MEFEYIDESEVEVCRKTKEPKTHSLFDEPKTNRTYWGKELCVGEEYHDDLGTKINFALTKGAIRRAIRNKILLDIDDYYLSARLNNEYRIELRKYQLELLEELIMSQYDNVSFVTDNDSVTHIVIS